LLQAALECGQAHVADRLGKTPKDASSWGWRRRSPDSPWIPSGSRIGWLVETNLYLDPAVSYRVTQEACDPEDSQSASKHSGTSCASGDF